jgi:hypothetical protein
MIKKLLFFAFLFGAISAFTQSGFTLVEEGGAIVITQFDTIRINADLMEYRRTESSFPDSSSADYYLTQRYTGLYSQAAEWANKAHTDSVSARRIENLLTDAGLSSLSAPSPKKAPKKKSTTKPNTDKDKPKKNGNR